MARRTSGWLSPIPHSGYSLRAAAHPFPWNNRVSRAERRKLGESIPLSLSPYPLR